MQALTVAISPSGIQYLTQQVIANTLLKTLKNLSPPNKTINPPDVILSISWKSGMYTEADNIAITLSGGVLSNFNPAFQSVTQNAAGQFTVVLVASNVTVYYSWNEQYDLYSVAGVRTYEGHSNNTWGYSMGIGAFTISVPITLAQQANSYTLTVGTVTATMTNLTPQIPGSSIIQGMGSCFSSTVDSATVSALEAIDFQTLIQTLFANLFGTVPASGKLTPNIVFNFNEGDSPLAFFPNNTGIALGVTGNVTWEGTAYSDGPAPSLAVPAVPSSNHVRFFAADYAFNELYWAFYKDGRLNTTITGRQLPDPNMLNTNYYQQAIPPLYQKYPNLAMTVTVTPQSALTVKFQTVYQLVYGDNGVLTTLEATLPTAIYQQLRTHKGAVYLTQGDYMEALQATLGPNGGPYLAEIQTASLVTGSFPQVYQVTAAGLASLQAQLPSGIYGQLAAALTVGQTFVDKAWLLVAVENALSSLAMTNQYAGIIETAFAVSGSYSQVYWVTPGTNGGLTTLVDQLPPDIYNDLVGFENIAYLDQTSFVTALQNAIGSAESQYAQQIENAALVNGAIATHNVQAVFNVIKAGQTIPVFTVNIQETDFQQNFRLAMAGYNQTVQFDFQLIDSETSATLVNSTIPGINSSNFPTIWNFALQPVYALELLKMAHTGVPLPFLAGFQFLFQQATVTVQPGYVDVISNVQYIGTPQFTEALTDSHAAPDALLAVLQHPQHHHTAARTGGHAPHLATWGHYRPTAALHRSRSTAQQTQLVRAGAPSGPATWPRTETVDLHFALGHLPAIEEFHLQTGAQTLALRAHTPETLATHARKNKALGLLDETARAQFTHYIEGVELSTRRASILRVTYPSATAPIPELALMSVHVPLWARLAHRQRRIPRTATGVPVGLARLGVTQVPPEDPPPAAIFDADYLVTTYSTAATVVFHHPQLATSDPTTAATVLDDHINSADNLTNVQRFQAQISRQGPNWQATVQSTDVNGKGLTWGPKFAKAGQPVYCNQLSATTLAGAGGALAQPLTTSQQDPDLQGACWSVNQGTGTIYHIPPANAQALRAGRACAKAAQAESSGGYSYTLNNLTPGHGLDIDDSSMTFTPDPGTPGAGTLTINVSNSYLRSLYAYAQFLDDHGKALPVTVNGQPAPGNYLPVGVVTPVNVILGIPMPTEPTVLSFDWMADAASTRLVHGGLGSSQWDNDVVWPGVILTGIFNYAIPGLFLIAGAELDSNAWFKAMEEDHEIVALLLKLSLGIFGAEASASVAFPDVSAILSALADAIAGFLVHEGLEALQEYIIEKIGETVLEDAIPYVDIFFEIANRAVDLAEIAETTVEVLLSPAVYEVDIVRTMDLTVTVSPDPTHGTPQNPAVWPQASATFEAIVQYQGGTSHTQSSAMMSGTSSQLITVEFKALPAGGSLQVKFNVYSATGFLCGQFTSAWQPAVLPENETVLTVVGSIQENLVPLSAQTVYQYQQKLVYNQAATAHMWQPNQFSLDIAEVGALDNGQISPDVVSVFQKNGCTLDSAATVETINQGSAWTITDGAVIYRLAVLQEPTPGGTVPVLMVNTANAPLQVVTNLSSDDQGHNLAKLVNITLNNKAYMLGYCWRASGQNIPETGAGFPLSTQIHAFQNINVLATPEGSLKFSPSGFVNQPAIVYDQFGPAPLFSVPRSFATELDQGGAVASDLVMLFQQFAYPLPGNAVAVVVTQGAAWTIGVPNAVPTYALARVTDVIAVHPYPSEIISQRNYYVQPTSDSPTSYQYQLRQITLDNTTPFDMTQTQSHGLFTLPFNDDFVVHPQGYVIAISYSLSRMMILKLPDAPAPDDQVVSAVIVSGPAGTPARPGLMNNPTALAVTTDGRILVLEQGTSTVAGRIQAFDVNGNPVPSFDGPAVTTLPTAYGADLDTGLISLNLRQALATAGTNLSNVWLVQDGTTLYQIIESNGQVVVTSGGANLSLHWTISSQGNSYQLSLDGANIQVAQSGTPLFTIPASLMVNLNQGLTTGGVATAFSQHSITLVAPVSVSGDVFTLDTSAVADLVNGTVPSALQARLAARGLSLTAKATVASSVTVTVREPGSVWTLQDRRTSRSYKISRNAATTGLDVVKLLATAPLYDQSPGLGITYIGMSTELKGYIYVLSYTGGGSSATDYRLDIYQPNGAWLARTVGVNAAKIIVDMWRNLYTLNYESFLGPGGRTEPSVSTWIPST